MAMSSAPRISVAKRTQPAPGSVSELGRIEAEWRGDAVGLTVT